MGEGRSTYVDSVEKGHVDTASKIKSVGGYLLNFHGGMLSEASSCVTIVTRDTERLMCAIDPSVV